MRGRSATACCSTTPSRTSSASRRATASACSRSRGFRKRASRTSIREDARLARQAFARGLCVIDDDTFAAGSSPSTITLHDLRPGGKARMATLTHDVRNAIHGLEVWPFGWNVARDR